MTTNADIVRDILYEAIIEIEARHLLTDADQASLVDAVNEFSTVIEEKPLTEEQKFILENKVYVGYGWRK